MSRPWMPLYVGDYLADTRHLSTQQHGAYMLLIMHYWRTGGLPNDDAQIARIAGLSQDEWLNDRSTMFAFFEQGWRHKRVEDELVKAEKLSFAGRTGGIASGEARKRTADERSFNGQANDLATNGQAPHSPSQPQLRKLSKKIVKAKSWTPPPHGATSSAKGRVYIQSGTPEWASYADDFRAAHGVEPSPNEHGGKWFKTLGEQIELSRKPSIASGPER